MDLLARAAQLLRPHMDEARRDTWLVSAFHAEYRGVYDAISQRGATRDFVIACVRDLLNRGCLGTRHALSRLLAVVMEEAGDEQRGEFQALMEGGKRGRGRENGDVPQSGKRGRTPITSAYYQQLSVLARTSASKH